MSHDRVYDRASGVDSSGRHLDIDWQASGPRAPATRMTVDQLRAERDQLLKVNADLNIENFAQSDLISRLQDERDQALRDVQSLYLSTMESSDEIYRLQDEIKAFRIAQHDLIRLREQNARLLQLMKDNKQFIPGSHNW